ncbi:probable E3 SUMO-protein ligase RNF212 [Pyrgilauda ruficollis]|uniref:probable E3 SUMO-protein ligase RNF212 n=1 Tax=Pyrgilauda ruficollis TaxID=221976 RepID=UPI001B8673A3|nr:probable E3 SUMO-protein ligase RNF212 [Pyrgilauda ruficollis]
MAVLVFCNSCLSEPRTPAPRFYLTSCGHVFCDVCLKKGKKDECLVCRRACRTVVLSKETSPDIQSLFMPIEVLGKKYSKEISQVSEFQERYRKRLLKHHKEKIAKLEESLKKVTQQIQQIQCMKPPEKTTPLPFSSTSRNPSIPSRKQSVYSSYSLHLSRPSTSETMEAMEIDPVPSPMRKLETPTGPTRLSVITPPQDGHMGSISYRSSQIALIKPSQSIGTGSTRSTPVVRLPHSSCPSSSGSQSSLRGSWANSDFRTPQLYPFTSPSPQLPLSRQPITLSGLLQRQQGSTNLGGRSAER